MPRGLAHASVRLHCPRKIQFRRKLSSHEQPQLASVKRVSLGEGKPPRRSIDETARDGPAKERTAGQNEDDDDGGKDEIEQHWARMSPSSSSIRRAFSGIQPTGVPHLGNYLGALRQWKRLHEQSTDPKFAMHYRYEQYFSVVDLHALTAETPASERLRLRKESYAALLALGLNNNRNTTLFFQSDVPQHASLMWILSTIASTGYLSRMTQWKSKLNLPENATLESDEATAKLKLGLFSYPVLQAADILLYQPSIVPVGEDQLQHIEFTRTLARGFNALVRESAGGNVFRIPWPVISPAKRIMSLKRPEQKMSKSDPDPKSRILVTDSPEEVHAKLRGAVTDSEPGISFDPQRRPGVSNLVEILRHVTESRESSAYIAQDNANVSMRAFKEMIADEIISALRGVRDNFLAIMDSGNERLREEIEWGGAKARRKARTTLDEVQQALGLFGVTLSEEEATRIRERRRQAVRKDLGTDLNIESNPFESDGEDARFAEDLPVRSEDPESHQKEMQSVERGKM
ncbi:tryptophan-tRNA ligase [Fonsecaea pedrosoi CBS 271.37]|uniref:tryptophan--tRNA ligase n=1 Tax=Fonsecaea pedrosoi CBS 271.37 TaxID=1442368 RepID=A0A0D2EM81_9EURO|nr:tryptophan-tRNA ligase [Fonsecaea pedrosoi CBS 271.37]KIW75492.1 tryptophan-tRNA ligase [Fonsecaea pedrosoi CBS 271.37]